MFGVCKIARNFFDRVVRDIKDIKIQGAEAVAVNASKAMAYYVKRINPELKPKEFWIKVIEGETKLLNTRPTEPAMHNVLKYLLFKQKKKNSTVLSFLYIVLSKSYAFNSMSNPYKFIYI